MNKNLKQCLVLMFTIVLSLTISSPISAAQAIREGNRNRDIAQMGDLQT